MFRFRKSSRFTSAIPLLALAAALAPLVACGRAQAADGPVPVEAAALHQQIESGAPPVIVDVRTPQEYAAGHVPGALNIPYDEMSARAAEIEAYKEEPVVLYCRSGRRSGIAAKTLGENGFKRLGLLEGDMPGWERAGYPVEK